MNKKHAMIFILAVGISMLFSTIHRSANAGGQSLVIIANKHLKANSISKSDVLHIFQKDMERISGAKVIPIHAKKTSPLRKMFNQQVLGMSINKEDVFWQQKKVQSGKLPPKELSNTIKAVAMVRGAIGYAFSSDVENNDSVKILLKL